MILPVALTDPTVLILPPVTLLAAEICPAVERFPTARLALMFDDVAPNTATLLVPATLTVTLPFALTIFTFDVPEFILVPAVVIPVMPEPLPTKYAAYTVSTRWAGAPMSYTASMLGMIELFAWILPMPLARSTRLLLVPVTVIVLPEITTLLPTGPAA